VVHLLAALEVHGQQRRPEEVGDNLVGFPVGCCDSGHSVRWDFDLAGGRTGQSVGHLVAHEVLEGNGTAIDASLAQVAVDLCDQAR